MDTYRLAPLRPRYARLLLCVVEAKLRGDQDAFEQHAERFHGQLTRDPFDALITSAAVAATALRLLAGRSQPLSRKVLEAVFDHGLEDDPVVTAQAAMALGQLAWGRCSSSPMSRASHARP